MDEISLKDACDSETPRLQELYEEYAEYMMNLNGVTEIASNYIKMCIEHGEVPPGGNRDNYFIKSIHRKNKIIGVVTFCRGYPSEDNLYIGWMYIVAPLQNKGIGRQAVELCVKNMEKQGINKCKVAVDNKNWPALNFWHKLGFDKITKIVGDKHYSDETFLKIELERALPF